MHVEKASFTRHNISVINIVQTFGKTSSGVPLTVLLAFFKN